MAESKGLSGNGLKIIAAVSMLLDHAGVIFFPRVLLLRILGRLAFPIFAYMIAEGCRYTRNRRRYFLTVFGLAAICQSVYFIYDRDLYMCILVTFSLSILMIYLLQNMKAAPTAWSCLLWGGAFALAVAAVWWLNSVVLIDYGFWGCMVPVFVAVFQGRGRISADKLDRKMIHVLMLGIGLVILAVSLGGVQHYSLLVLPLLMAYSGKIGRFKMKYFFYLFYPLHLAALEGLAMLLK